MTRTEATHQEFSDWRPRFSEDTFLTHIGHERHIASACLNFVERLDARPTCPYAPWDRQIRKKEENQALAKGRDKQYIIAEKLYSYRKRAKQNA